ncbi:MAG: ferritin-like domain-containing protein [Acidobacteria bacterium]|nr:ferritin-like domain-containing protein [Acidobacteriota bacterium]
MKLDQSFEKLSDELVEVGEMLKGRRGFLKAGMLAGAATTFAMLAANGVSAQDMMKDEKKKDKKGKGGGGAAEDIKIVNIALGLEYQAIYAYDVAASTGLLSAGTKGVALLFQSQHKEHAALEENAIKQLGGTPVARQEKYELGDLSGIKTEKDLLTFALGKEAGAASAYMGVLSMLSNKDLIPVVAGIGANEAQHAALLRFAMGEANPVPMSVVK